MIITETKLNLADLDEFVGTLFVTDAQLIANDSGILRLGDDMGLYWTHIACQMGPHEAHRLLDKAFSEFLNACCRDLWCDAVVHYFVDEDVLLQKEYGFSDGAYTMHINVYCGEDVDVQKHLTELQDAISPQEPLIVVQPDSSHFGFSATRFA